MSNPFCTDKRVTGVVRSYGNWEARLATTCVSVQKGLRTVVLPEKFCANCLREGIELGEFVDLLEDAQMIIA
jgi:hypothetical protein